MKNKIQYISLTHTSKEEALAHKTKCNGAHTVYMADLEFDQVADLLDSGNIIGRLGNTTTFVAIDIDHTSVNISKVYEIYENDPDVRVSYGSSNNPLSYHILVNLHKEITIDEYKQCLEDEFNKIANNVKGECDWIELDKNASNFHQCFFGQQADNCYENIIEGSIPLYCWTKKGNEPRILRDSKITYHPSLNSADFCKKNGLLTIKEDKRFDIVLPSMTNGRLKRIAEGHRFNWCRMIGTKIMMRIFYLNEKFNEGWTKWDFLDTVEWAIRENIENVNSFEDDIKTLLLWLDNKWDILVNRSFEEKCEILESYFNSSKRPYKSRKYNPTIMSNMIMEHLYDDNTIVFTDKDELKQICSDSLIDYYKFIRYAKDCHYEIAFEVENKKTRKCKYDCEGMNKEEFDTYCKENNINKVIKSRLKKKYGIK